MPSRAAARMALPGSIVWRTDPDISVTFWQMSGRVVALGLALVAAPLAAQQRPVDIELRALIPDEAVARPDEWARLPGTPASSSLAPNAAVPAPDAAPTPSQYAAAHLEQIAPDRAAPLDPNSPLVDLAGMTLAWPGSKLDLPELAPLPPDLDPLPQVAVVAVPSLSAEGEGGKADAHAVSVHGRILLTWPSASAIPERAEFEARFRSLLALQVPAGKDQETLGTLAVRAANGRALLERLLKTYGYYEGEVVQSIGGIATGANAATATANIRFDIVPGPRFRFGNVDLGKQADDGVRSAGGWLLSPPVEEAQLTDTGADFPILRKSFGIHSGDPLYGDAISTATASLSRALGEMGYPFARVGEPALVVDHRREEGDLTLPVSPGGKYRFGAISSSLPQFLSSRHLSKIARFKEGQTFQQSGVDDLRRAVLATGLVSSLTITPRETKPSLPGEPGVVGLDVAMTKAPLRSVSGEVGYDTAEGVRLELGWEHRNLFPPEGLLRLRGIIGTKEQLAGVTFRRNNFGGRDRVLTVDLYANNATLSAYAARKLAFGAFFERQTTLLFQKPWTWSVGGEVEYSAEREGVLSGITTGRITYTTLAAPLRGAYDGSDDLLDPSRGFRAALRISPEYSRARNQNSIYARVQADASWYWSPAKSLVLAGRVRLGTMPGTALADIAPSRRFYAGGGGSIRGFGYKLVGPRNGLGDPQGGRSLYEFSLEARVKTGLFGGALSVVPFVDAGGADTSPVIGLRDMRYGAGLGVRYQTGFGPIRLDVGTPLKRRPGESLIGVYVALGQAF